MPRTPESPLEVTRYIGTILRRKRALLDELHQAELDAWEKRHECDVQLAHTFLRAEGSIPQKDAIVEIDKVIRRLKDEAKIAELAVKHLMRMVGQCNDELDGARTAAATLRAEFSVMGLTDEGA